MSSDTNSKATSTRRRTLERSWVIGVVIFVVVRFLLAYSELHSYPLTVWIFGFIDLVTAVPYALGTARLVTSIVDHAPRAAARWGIVASVSFLAPYIWLAWRGRKGQFPTIVYVVVALLVVCLGANAIISVRRRVRRDSVAGALAEASA